MQGFARVRVDGQPVELADRDSVKLARYEQHTIEVVVDRLVRREGDPQRLTDSIETALGLTGGTAEVLLLRPRADDEVLTFSQHLACANCGLSFEELAPRDFSFNSPYGACPRAPDSAPASRSTPSWSCPTRTLSLADGALAPWAGARTEYFTGLVNGIAELGGFSVDTPGRSSGPRTASSSSTAPAPDGPRPYRNRYGRSRTYDTQYEGIVAWLERRHDEAESDWSREQVEQYMREVECTACRGPSQARVLAVTVGGRTSPSCAASPSARPSTASADLDLTERDH